jgi:hypothetical protein
MYADFANRLRDAYRQSFDFLVYNLTVAVGAELINGKYLWHTRNQTILWAANHPVTGNNCTHIKIAENVTFSAACSFGPILALCQTQ